VYHHGLASLSQRATSHSSLMKEKLLEEVERSKERERDRQTDRHRERAQRKAGSVGCWFGLLDSLEGGMGCAEVAKIPSGEAGIDS